MDVLSVTDEHTDLYLYLGFGAHLFGGPVRAPTSHTLINGPGDRDELDARAAPRRRPCASPVPRRHPRTRAMCRGAIAAAEATRRGHVLTVERIKEIKSTKIPLR